MSITRVSLASLACNGGDCFPSRRPFAEFTLSEANGLRAGSAARSGQAPALAMTGWVAVVEIAFPRRRKAARSGQAAALAMTGGRAPISSLRGVAHAKQ